jgi:GNAT superfamily N-acetyltransferase
MARFDKSEINYREAGSDDISMLVEYRVQFLKELQGIPSAEMETDLRKELFDYFQWALANQSYIGLIAELNDDPVGFGGMVIHRMPAHFNLMNGLAGYILNMYTLPVYRKNGIGSEILTRLVSYGKKIKMGRIYLNATREGIELYRSLGFKEPDFPELEYLDI